MIFMDHMMPDMDGVVATKRIRKMDNKCASQVVIVALTANAVEGVEEEYREAGMNDCLFKPVNSEQLKEKLLQHLPPEKVVCREEERGSAE